MKLQILLLCIVVLGVLYAAGRAKAETRVIDGDTLEIDGTVVRLRDFDAFEADQTCRYFSGDMKWFDHECGADATDLLETLVQKAQGRVKCAWEESDVYGRALGDCHIETETGGQVDIGMLMISTCRAMPYGRGSRYRGLFELAKSQGIGYCRPGFALIPPWEWRRGVRYKVHVPR